MTPTRTLLMTLPLIALLPSLPATAGEEEQKRIEALERRIDQLESLLRGLQPPPAPRTPEPSTQPARPAAEVEARLKDLEARMKERDEAGSALDRFHFHGYGEVHYNNPKTANSVLTHRNNPAQTDVHRLVFGAAYDFTDTVRMDFEGEFEHAGGTMEVEYAFLEMDIQPGLSFRAGSLLMPFGALNEFHEPTNFYSVERPYLQTVLIPTTWMEIGAGVTGRSADGLHAYRSYLVTGLTASSFTAETGIRNGRTKGNQGSAGDLAWVGRYENAALLKRLKLGISAYVGEADQDGSSFENVSVTMGEIDAQYRWRDLELQAAAVLTAVGNADQLSVSRRQTIGNRQRGWNAEAAWHIRAFRDEAAGTDKEFVPFLRYESFDTHAGVPQGFIMGREFERQVVTTGLSFFPTAERNVAIKGDVEFWRDGLNQTSTRYNLGVGFTY